MPHFLPEVGAIVLSHVDDDQPAPRFENPKHL